MIVIGFGLFIWVQADPVSTVSGAVARGIVLLTYAVAMFVWAAAGLARVLLNRHFSPNGQPMGRKPTTSIAAPFHNASACCGTKPDLVSRTFRRVPLVK